MMAGFEEDGRPTQHSRGAETLGEDAAPRTPAARSAVPRPTAKAAGAGAEPVSGSTSFLATAYVALALFCLSSAVNCFVAPAMAVRTTISKDASTPLDSQLIQLVRLNGGAQLVVAAAAATLAARGLESMGPRGSDLLKLGVAGESLVKTLLFSLYPATLSRLGLPVEIVATLLVAALPLADLLRSGNGRGLIRELSRRLAPARPGSLLAGAHWMLALLFPLSGVALLFAPRFTLFHMLGYSYGSAAFLLARLAGVVDTTLIPLTHLLLKGAAERGALALPAARLLLVGMLLAGLGHLAVEMPLMASGECRWLLPVNAATWAASALTCAATLLASADRWAHPNPAASKAEAQAGKKKKKM